MRDPRQACDDHAQGHAAHAAPAQRVLLELSGWRGVARGESASEIASESESASESASECVSV